MSVYSSRSIGTSEAESEQEVEAHWLLKLYSSLVDWRGFNKRLLYEAWASNNRRHPTGFTLEARTHLSILQPKVHYRGTIFRRMFRLDEIVYTNGPSMDADTE